MLLLGFGAILLVVVIVHYFSRIHPENYVCLPWQRLLLAYAVYILLQGVGTLAGSAGITPGD